jgi:fatty acid-binding protein DegV
LEEAARTAGVTIHIATMSITSGAHTGPGCLTVSFISDKHIFEEKV